MQLIIAILLAIFLLLILMPAVQHKWQQVARMRLIRRIERQRHSRVITLIHRQERVSFLGIPILRFIDVEDAVQLLRAIRLTSPDVPIDVILHTPGGLALPAQQIAYALKQHPAPVIVMVPHYAMSGGTLIALAADQILMDSNAVLGSVDPQVRRRGEILPAAAILSVFQLKEHDKLGDGTIMLANVADKAIDQMRSFVRFLLEDRMGMERANVLAETMTEGRWTHDYPLTVPLLQQMGLPVRVELQSEIHRLMELYPQPTGPRAVQYVPVPYRRGDAERDDR